MNQQMNQQNIIGAKIQAIYDLAGGQSAKIKQELMDFAGSISDYGKSVPDNIKLLDKCIVLQQTLINNIEGMIRKGLNFASGDYYIFIQKGGKLMVSMSPSGRAKAIDNMLEKKEVRVTLSIGIVRDSDEVSLSTVGTIQTMTLFLVEMVALLGAMGLYPYFQKKQIL